MSRARTLIEDRDDTYVPTDLIRRAVEPLSVADLGYHDLILAEIEVEINKADWQRYVVIGLKFGDEVVQWTQEYMRLPRDTADPDTVGDFPADADDLSEGDLAHGEKNCRLVLEALQRAFSETALKLAPEPLKGLSIHELSWKDPGRPDLLVHSLETRRDLQTMSNEIKGLVGHGEPEARLPHEPEPPAPARP